MDRHLNLFYTYNHSNELIENNLTRAFIVTIRALSAITRKTFFYKLNSIFIHVNFTSTDFCLQNWMKFNPIDFKYKFILTISTHTKFKDETEFNKIDNSILRRTLIEKKLPKELNTGINGYLTELLTGSIPDAWIFDNALQYCFLIECKINNDEIYYSQIIRHAYEKYGFSSLLDINNCLIRITWDDILNTLKSILSLKETLNDQEHYIVNNFIQYMSFFGYHLFQGFNFLKLSPKPPNLFKSNLFNFSKLMNIPVFQILHRKMFFFECLSNSLLINFH